MIDLFLTFFIPSIAVVTALSLVLFYKIIFRGFANHSKTLYELVIREQKSRYREHLSNTSWSLNLSKVQDCPNTSFKRIEIVAGVGSGRVTRLGISINISQLEKLLQSLKNDH